MAAESQNIGMHRQLATHGLAFRLVWRTATLVWISFCGLCLAGVSGPQEGPCDSQLQPLAGDSNGYRVRGDRCEGIYIKEVAGGANLLVASFTESFEDYNPASGTDLLIDWKAPERGEVRLRAYALKRRLYYRMDTLRPSNSASFVWPSGLLTVLSIAKRDLGVVGWMSYRVGDAKREVYLPLKIRPRGVTSRSKSYQLILLPGAELSEVFITLAHVGADGFSDRYVKKGAPLSYGYYPAERGIMIPIPELPVPGVYSMEIGATLKDSGASTTRLWFYHGG